MSQKAQLLEDRAEDQRHRLERHVWNGSAMRAQLEAQNNKYLEKLYSFEYICVTECGSGALREASSWRMVEP